MTQAINWFEILVTDLDRSQRFYESVLGRALRREAFGDEKLAVFPYDPPGPGGCLQQAPARAPSAGGIRIYLDCEPSIDAALARVEAAGGQIVQPKTKLPKDMGYIAHLRDPDGNEVGLHAKH